MKTIRCLVVCAAILLEAASSSPLAQQTPTDVAPSKRPEFDVASVKPNTLLEQPSNNWKATPGQTDFHNSQVIELIRLAWNDSQLRVEKGPDWIARGRFDIVAQYPIDTPR